MSIRGLSHTLARWVFPIAGVFLAMVILGITLLSARHSVSFTCKPVVGHNGSPLLAFFYAAERNDALTSVKFNSSSDAGYAMLSGTLDAGFIEPEKILELNKLKGFERLVVLGKVTFPYGVTLVTKKGSQLRLQEIDGRTIAVPSDNTRLLVEFKKALAKYPMNLDRVDYRFLPSDAIIPALESGSIDGAIVKGSQAVIALNKGHNMLFQKWDMEPGNECCPPVIDQLEFVLLARKDRPESNEELTKRLTDASAYEPSDLREALSKAEHVPEALFGDLPLATFEPADDRLLEVISRHSGASHKQQQSQAAVDAAHDELHVHDGSNKHGVLPGKRNDWFDLIWKRIDRFFRAK